MDDDRRHRADAAGPAHAGGAERTPCTRPLRGLDGRTLAKGIAWSVLPLAAGLFVLVETPEKTGVTAALAGSLHGSVERSATLAARASGSVLAVGCDAVNNLPAGPVAGRVVELARVLERVRAAGLIGVDPGPNPSVTGSLATILWPTAPRREGLHGGAWTSLKLGARVMPPAPLLARALLGRHNPLGG